LINDLNSVFFDILSMPEAAVQESLSRRKQPVMYFMRLSEIFFPI